MRANLDVKRWVGRKDCGWGLAWLIEEKQRGKMVEEEARPVKHRHQDPSTGSSEVCVSEGRDAETQAEICHCWGEGDILALSNCVFPCGKFPTEISQKGIIVRN